MFNMVFVVLALTALALARAGRAPNSDFIDNFRKTPLGSKFSDDIYADALLDVPDLVAKNGYPVERHAVTTADGYVLTAHRIPRGRAHQPGPRPVVFLMHGLFSSSADFIVLGPGNALAYLLAEEGYDVWLGNARGNFYSRKHLTLDPDRDADYWRFSWEEIGLHDLPAFVDYILALTGEDRMHYVAHSQGGTTFLVLNSLKPEYNAKFKSFQGLAPASYFDNNESALFRALAQFEKLIETVALSIGIGEILSNAQAQALVSALVCAGAPLFEPACLDAVTGASGVLGNLNSSMIPMILSHAPAGSSIRQSSHYGQVIRRGVFARFNHDLLTNLRLYGRAAPPEFDVARVTAPAFLYYGLGDREVNYRDLLHLATRLGNTVATYTPPREEFNHFDFIWGNDIKVELLDVVIKNMKQFDLTL